jgi:tetratricopeptide (TPR) repeat protein
MGTRIRLLLIAAATGALLWTCNIASAQDADRETCRSRTAPPDQVEAACTQVLTRGAPLSDKDRAVVLIYRGFAYENKGEYDRAISDYSEAIGLKPDDAYAFNRRGIAYSHKGEYDKAISDYDEAIRLKPDYAYPFNDRGIVYSNKGEYDKAISDYNEAILLKPDEAEAFHNRGNVYSHKGEYDKAISDYNEAIGLKPDAAETFHNRGNVYSHKGEYDKAISDYNEAIRLKPDNAFAFDHRGNAYSNKGEYDKAISDYNEAIRLRPDVADAFVDRANAQVEKHEYDQAIADADAAARLDPKFSNPHAARSRALLAKGNVSGALAEAERAVALKPNYMGGLVARGEAEAKNGDLRRALGDFNRALAVIGVDRSPYWVKTAEEDRTPVVAALGTAAATESAPPQPIPTAPAGRHVALVVANGAYRDAPLANPGVDADLIKEGLEGVGFKVTVKRDLPLDGFEQALEDFADEAKGAEVALFYFAGHGFSLDSGGVQQNLLMATDANFHAKTGYALQGSGESLEHLQQVITGHAHATLIFIDACRNIPVVASRGLGGRGFAPIDASAFDGAFVVISTRQGKTADDGEAGQGSPFARAVAKVLPTPNLRVEDAYYLIRDEVSAETSGAQVPDLIRSDLPKGGLVLAQKP